jgi:PAS domain S-box-containing protein
MQSGVPRFDLEVHGVSQAYTGEERIWRTSYSPLRGRGKKAVGVNMVVYDITEHRQTEKALREKQQELEDFIYNAGVGLHWVRSDGIILWANQYELALLGYAREEYISHHIAEFHADQEMINDMLARLARGETLNNYEVRLRCKDGSIRHVLINANVFRKDGEFIHTRFFTRDITTGKRAEEALYEARAALAHVMRVMTMGELIATVAHEVNQPLGAIVTNGQACLRLLARESPDLQKSRQAIERVVSEGMRANEVIMRMRALLQKKHAETVLLHVNEIIQEVIALASPELSKSAIRVQTALAANLPPVRGDQVQLQQVLLNLILNAKEAMSGVGWQPRALRITSLASTSGEVVVAVRDSGTGLDPRHGDRIFEAFFTTKAEGLGLGLSISRTIIDAHGGRLWATPSKDQGTTIQFTLPAGERRV